MADETDPFPLEVQPGSDLTIPWAFYIGKDGQSGNGSHSVGDNRQTEIMDFNWSDYARGDCLRQLLGRHRLSSSGKLKRQPPMRHPMFPQMRATNVTNVQRVSFQGKNTTDYDNGPMGEYVRARLTVVFQDFRWPVLNDADFQTAYGPGAPEYYRYALRESKQSIQVGKRDGYQFRYTFLNGGTSPSGPSPGAAFNGDVFFVIPTLNIKITWYEVPCDMVINTSTDRATNFENCLGKVNSQPFWGVSQNLLLFKPFDIIRRPSPVYLGDLKPGQAKDYVNVVLSLDQFDPPCPALLSQTTTGVTSGMPQITGIDTTYLIPGETVLATGFPSGVFPNGTVIASVDSPTQITVSNNFTGTTGTSTVVQFIVDAKTPNSNPYFSNRGYSVALFPYDGFAYPILTVPGGVPQYRSADFNLGFTPVTQT